MDHLTKLFTLLEYTRAMPQTGYVLSGLKRQELGNLAEHHYLVVMIAWQLALVTTMKNDIAATVLKQFLHMWSKVVQQPESHNLWNSKLA